MAVAASRARRLPPFFLHGEVAPERRRSHIGLHDRSMAHAGTTAEPWLHRLRLRDCFSQWIRLLRRRVSIPGDLIGRYIVARGSICLLAIVAAASLTLLIATACGGGSEQGISLEADDFYFEPQEIKAQAGQPLTIRIENEGRNPHTFTIESLGVDVELQPGEERTVTLTPTSTVDFVCRFHQAQGMAGRLTVGQ